MAKRPAGGLPWGWIVGLGVVVGLIAREKLRSPRCKECDVALRALEAGSGYLCPNCGKIVTAWEVVFGIA